MRLLAALAGAVSVFLVVQGVAAWRTPRPRRTTRRARTRRSTTPPLQTQLRQAGLAIGAAQYRASVAGTAVATFVAVYAVTGTVSVSLVPAVAVAFAPRAYYRNRRATILHDRVAAWPEAIRDVLTHLAVDRTVHQALVELGHSGPEPLRPVWATYARNAAVLDTPSALAQVRADLADPTSDHVVEALDAAHDRGSTVAVAVLEAVADQIARDLAMNEEIVTAQSETRSQAVFAVVLPFVMLAVLVASNDGFARFYSRPVGWVVVAVGAGLAAVGWKIIAALGTIPDEPRILARRPPT